MKILFAGGGTGGHLFAGIALAEAFREAAPQVEILFVGTAYGLEKRMIPEQGYRLELIPVKQLKGKGKIHRLKTLAELPRAFLKSYLLLRTEKPHLVFGIGGYASGPLTLTARWMGIPTAILEQNSMPGITNRILGRFVHRIFIAFENAKKFFPKERTFLCGNPVRKSFFRFDQDTRGDASSFTLLILGGSQGAHSINQAMAEASSDLSSLKGLQIIHQTGKADAAWVSEAYQKAGLRSRVLEFISDIQNHYARADLVIARAGAGTIAELENMGKPALLIPYPFAADDHQRLNALELVNAGAARVILNHELDAERIFQEICALMSKPEALLAMGEKAKALAKPQAAQEIVKILVTGHSLLSSFKTRGL